MRSESLAKKKKKTPSGHSDWIHFGHNQSEDEDVIDCVPKKNSFTILILSSHVRSSNEGLVIQRQGLPKLLQVVGSASAPPAKTNYPAPRRLLEPDLSLALIQGICRLLEHGF